MDIAPIIRILSGPLIGAVIGYFTNMIAVKMLFYPKHEIRVFGRRLPLNPGVIPKGRPRLAASIGNVIEKNLLTKDDIKTHLLTEQAEKKITDVAVAKLSCNIKHEICRFADMDSAAFEEKKTLICQAVSLQVVNAIRSSNATETVLSAVGETVKERYNNTLLRLFVNDTTLSTLMEPTKEVLDTMIDEHGADYISPILATKLEEAANGSGLELMSHFEIDEQTVRETEIKSYRKLVDQCVEGVLSSINISELIEDKINDMSIDELERLVQDVMKKELGAIINLGALIGFILGLLNLII